MLPVVEKAIRESDLGLNPASSGDMIRVPMPPLTAGAAQGAGQDRAQEGENAKVAVRNLRRDANTHLKELLKEKEVSEDDEQPRPGRHPEDDRPLRRRDRQADRREGKGDHDGLTAPARPCPVANARSAVSRVPPRVTLPRHVAIIMDGNGRWATERHLPRVAGHRAASRRCATVVEACGRARRAST